MRPTQTPTRQQGASRQRTSSKAPNVQGASQEAASYLRSLRLFAGVTGTRTDQMTTREVAAEIAPLAAAERDILPAQRRDLGNLAAAHMLSVVPGETAKTALEYAAEAVENKWTIADVEDRADKFYDLASERMANGDLDIEPPSPKQFTTVMAIANFGREAMDAAGVPVVEPRDMRFKPQAQVYIAKAVRAGVNIGEVVVEQTKRNEKQRAERLAAQRGGGRQ